MLSPAGHEVVLKGELIGHNRDVVSGISLLEAPTNLTELSKKGLLVARAVVTAGDATLPVRIYNSTRRETTVKKGMMVARLCSVQEVEDVGETSSSQSNRLANAVPEHLQDLYQRSTEHIS